MALKAPPAEPSGFGIDKLIFVLALCFFAFAYGVASMQWKLFPYSTVQEARLAWKAWRQLDDDREPPQIIGWVPGATVNSPVRRLDAGAGSEPLLVVGGFHSRLDLCPRFGCLAFAIRRDGTVLHTWPAPDPDKFFTGLQGFSGRVMPGNIYLIGAAVQADGSLVTTFHGHNMFPYQVGIARFDKRGQPLWKHFDNSHHWPVVGADGRIYVPSMRAVKNPATYVAGTHVPTACKAGTAYIEGVKIYAPDGTVTRDFVMRDILARADYPGLAYAIKDGCDAYHINGVDLVNAAAAARLGHGVGVGDILVSLREPSALAVIGKDRGELKWLLSGRTAAQHSPRFLADGTIVVFDNLGGDLATGGSRVLWIDPATNTTRAVFPHGGTGPGLPFFSVDSGAVNVSADGTRVMASPSKQGRTIEIDVKTGKPLWMIDNVMDFAPVLKARGIERRDSFARTTANGVHYLGDVDLTD